MKTPLRYQISDFDCGSVSLLNCLSYLFDREEIPTELVRVISTYSLTFYDVKGRLDKTTTQKSLPFYISAWINKFALQKLRVGCATVDVDFVPTKGVAMGGYRCADLFEYLGCHAITCAIATIQRHA